ncbi:MAG: filamentous hemagglutinin N-terminal domain-containing protein [Gammaproteobacteria bacterium]|nr:filamentous hemagglutinin N-terminal domain-containing protein [Gammaproteobacteria bacterium]
MYKFPSAYALMLILSITSGVYAEVVFDGTLGSDGALQGPNFAVEAGFGRQAGQNLFHSFASFSLKSDESAIFLGPDSINNVISRVTGGKVSHIDGLLQSAIENVYFLNPAGVMFGPNARLSISGSLHVSTADYLRLGEAGRFDATHPEQSRLAIAPPGAFGFLTESPAGIVKKSSLLLVRPGKILSFIGGDLTLEDTREAEYESLIAQGGRINLISAASPGEVPANPENMPDTAFARMGTIRITDKTVGADNLSRGIGNVDVSGPGGGRVYIHGGRIVLDNGYIFADTFGAENGQGITIKAADELLARQARITTQVVSSEGGENTAGDAGDISISAGRITLKEGAQVDSNNWAGTSGAAGNIDVFAEKNITISGRFSFSDEKNFSSGLLSNTWNSEDGGRISVSAPTLVLRGGIIRADTNDSGTAGDVVVQVDKLTLMDGGQINVSSGNWKTEAGRGDGGKMTISARESVLISGDAGKRQPSGLLSNTFTEGEGGHIEVSTAVLEVENGGTIQAVAKSAGKGGKLLLDVETLHIHRNGFIVTDTDGSGEGGNIEINARKAVIIAEGDSQLRGNLSSTSLGTGDAGQIFIATPRLMLHQGGQIKSATQNTGQGGKIIVNAGGTIYITDAGSGLSTATEGAGKGGTITLKAGNTIQLVEGGTITSESKASGNAGDVSVDGKNILLRDGTIATQSLHAGGGDIQVEAQESIHIFSSKALAYTKGNEPEHKGGNISVTVPLFVTLKDSEIRADAQAGNGGNISISTKNFVENHNNVLDASSELGIDGKIEIDSPVVDLGEVFVPHADIEELPNLNTERCESRSMKQFSQFFIQKGKLPPPPNDLKI